MNTLFAQCEGLRCTRLAVVLVCLTIAACDSPVSPEPMVVARFSLPASFVGLWHGVSARQVSGPALGWNLDDMLLRSDGFAEIIEYEGPGRRFTGTWYLDLQNAIVIQTPFSTCRRTGTVDGNTMILTCVAGSRTWSLVFTKSQ